MFVACASCMCVVFVVIGGKEEEKISDWEKVRRKKEGNQLELANHFLGMVHPISSFSARVSGSLVPNFTEGFDHRNKC